jgi:hypothetical protein
MGVVEEWNIGMLEYCMKSKPLSLHELNVCNDWNIWNYLLR